MHRDRPLPVFHNEDEKAKWRNELVRDNQHIADAHFIDRVKIFLSAFLEKLIRMQVVQV